REYQIDASVRGFDINPFAIPSISAELDRYTAVDRLAVYCAGKLAKRYATVDRVEIDATAYACDIDAAVVSFQREVRIDRDEELKADSPTQVPPLPGTTL